MYFMEVCNKMSMKWLKQFKQDSNHNQGNELCVSFLESCFDKRHNSLLNDQIVTSNCLIIAYVHNYLIVILYDKCYV